MHLEDCRAVVTGAASGIGAHVVERLAQAGAQVVAADVDFEGLLQLAERCRKHPGRIHPLAVDVSNADSVASFAEEALRELPRVNVLMNCAGVLADSVLLQPEEGWTRRLPPALWRRVLDTNLSGPFLVAREIAPAMLPPQGQGGIILNISSLARSGNAGQSAYAASKAGLDAATRSWALELAPYQVRVVGIAPGVIETPMLAHITGAARERLLARVPLQRFGTVEEIWHGVAFVIACEYFNGRVLEIDGGTVL